MKHVVSIILSVFINFYGGIFVKSLFLLTLFVGWACGEQQLEPNGGVRSVANVVKSVGKHTSKIVYHAGRASEVTTLDKLLKHVIEVHSHVQQARAKFAQELAKVSDSESLLHINGEFQQWGVKTQADLAYRRDRDLHIKVNLTKARDIEGAKLVMQRLQEIDNMLAKPLAGVEKALRAN